MINPFICVGLPIFSIGFNWFKLYGVRIVQQVIRYSDLFVICVYLAILYCLFLAALGSPAGKGLTSWLSFMWHFLVLLSLFHRVSCVRCGTWLYRILIFVFFPNLLCSNAFQRELQWYALIFSWIDWNTGKCITAQFITLSVMSIDWPLGIHVYYLRFQRELVYYKNVSACVKANKFYDRAEHT